MKTEQQVIKILATKQEAIELIKSNKKQIEDFPEYCDDKEVILEAVKHWGLNLMAASERLKDDKEVVMEAVRSYSMALKYASERLQDNNEIVAEAVRECWPSLQFASKRLRNNADMLMELVRECELTPAFKFPSVDSQNDKDAFLLAVRRWNFNLKYLSEILQKTLG